MAHQLHTRNGKLDLMHPKFDIFPKFLVFTAVPSDMLTHGFVGFLHDLV